MMKDPDWHFPEETLHFLEDLRDNNNRDWFNAHKPAYQTAFKQPAERFGEIMVESLDELTGRQHRAKLFRIHRDVRFSKDKTPYNAHVHMSFSPLQPHATAAAWMFGLDAESLTLGIGSFAFDKVVLEKYRNRLAGEDGGKLAAMLQQLSENGMRCNEPELKRVPRGFEPDHPRADLLRCKGLTLWSDLAGPEIACKPGLVPVTMGEFKQMLPVFDWLSQL